MAGEVAQVDAEGQMRPAFHGGHDLPHALLVDVHGGDPRACGGERGRNLAADAARSARDDNSLALEPGADIPAHDVVLL